MNKRIGEDMIPTLNELHDGNIIGIINDVRKENSIILIEHYNKFFSLLLVDVKHMKINNFSKGNIILDIETFNGKQFEKFYYRFKKEFLNFLDMGETTENKRYLKSLLEKLLRGDLVYIEINPSIGCDVQIICKSYEIKKGFFSKSLDFL